MARRIWIVLRQSDTRDGTLSIESQDTIATEAVEGAGDVVVGRSVERSVSGGRPLAKRPGLLQPVEAVEAGAVDAVLGVYFDRLFREGRVQDEVVERIEDAGGEIGTVTGGRISYATPSSWYAAKQEGLTTELYRRQTSQKVRDAQALRVQMGVPPGPLPPGLRVVRDAIGRPQHVEHVAELAPVIVQAFQMRSQRESIEAVRQFLAANGVVTKSGKPLRPMQVQRLLANPLYVGNIVWGELENLGAFPPLVPPDLFRRVQSVKAPRGPQSKSERLLARQGVLLCWACSSRLIVGKSGSAPKRTDAYVCSNPDCSQKVAVRADLAEAIVWEAAKHHGRNGKGRAELHDELNGAKIELQDAQEALRRFVRVFDADDDLDAAREQKAALRADIAAKQARVDELSDIIGPAEVVTMANIDDDVTVDERRDVIRQVIDRVIVTPGRGGRYSGSTLRAAIERRLQVVPRGQSVTQTA